MLYSITVSDTKRQGSNTFNLEESVDLLICSPDEIVQLALAELSLQNLKYRIIGSQIPLVGHRQVEAKVFLGGNKFPPMTVKIDVHSPKSTDSPSKWNFLGAQKKKVLVLCSGNSCRSQMAEGILKNRYQDTIEVYSAGFTPGDIVNPHAIAVMAEIGIDISRHQPKPIQVFRNESFDYIVSVCDVDANNLPFATGSAVTLDFGVVDPSAYEGTLPSDELLTEFQSTRDEISDVLDRFAAEISNELSFVTSRSDRRRAVQRVFKPIRDKQKVTQSQLNKVVSNPVSGVEVIEICVSDMKLALIESIEEPQRLFSIRVGFGVALAVTLLTSTFTVEFLPDQLSQRASDFLDVIGWSVATIAILFGLKAGWSERAKPTKQEVVDTIMKKLAQQEAHNLDPRTEVAARHMVKVKELDVA